MNREIQLHDCELSEVSHIDGSTLIVLSTAYIHESSGVPGFDPGLIWTQIATITIGGTTPIAFLAPLPIWVLHGSLRIGQTLYEEFLPAGGDFEEATEFIFALSTEDGGDGGIFTLKGTAVKIDLVGERSDIEEFNGTPRREI